MAQAIETLIEWNLGLFRADSTGEIFSVPSDIISVGFFQNVGNTRCQGVETSVGYRDDTRAREPAACCDRRADRCDRGITTAAG